MGIELWYAFAAAVRARGSGELRFDGDLVGLGLPCGEEADCDWSLSDIFRLRILKIELRRDALGSEVGVSGCDIGATGLGDTGLGGDVPACAFAV